MGVKPEASMTESTYYILISLAEPRHGYGIMQHVESISDGEFKLGPATLYTVLSKLVEQGLIVRLAGVPGEDERRKPYALTEKGIQSLAAEIIRREKMAALGREALSKIGGDLDVRVG